jgi:hypothetical protein
MERVEHNGDVSRRLLRRPAVWFCAVGLAAAIAVLLLRLAEPKFYRAVTLPSYGGEPFHPHGINDDGQIVGRVTTANGKSGVALWDREHGIRELGIASNGLLAINNAGQIAGEMYDPNGKTAAFLWDPNAGLVQVGRGSVREGWVVAINRSGQMVGSYKTALGSTHPCIWDDADHMRDLNPSDMLTGRAYHINDSGQILGVFHAERNAQACLWDLSDPNFTDWMSLPGHDDTYCALNNGGHVLGDMVRPTEGLNALPQRYAMLWHKDREPTWLFPLVDFNARVAYLNDANQVVYYETHRSSLSKWFPRWFPSSKRTFLWDPVRGSISLDMCLKLGGRDYFEVRGLNNKGCIVGVVLSATGVQKRAVLLEPIARKWRR